jgi:hypothetical protein
MDGSTCCIITCDDDREMERKGDAVTMTGREIRRWGDEEIER